MKNSKNKCYIFFPNGFWFYFCSVFLVLPYFAAIYFFVIGEWRIALMAPLISFLFYIGMYYNFHFVVFKNEIIKAYPRLAFICTEKYKDGVCLSDIVFASFEFFQDDSIKNTRLRVYEIPCLRLTMNDESVVTIILTGYSKKQIRMIELKLKELNHNILFERSSDFITKCWR